MALLSIDSKTLNVQVKVGVLEEYKPDRTIKAIVKKAAALKKMTSQKLVDLVGEISVEEANKKIQADAKVRKQWTDFLHNEYNPALTELIVMIKKKNEQICPNYKAAVKQLEVKE